MAGRDGTDRVLPYSTRLAKIWNISWKSQLISYHGDCSRSTFTRDVYARQAIKTLVNAFRGSAVNRTFRICQTAEVRSMSKKSQICIFVAHGNRVILIFRLGL